MNILFFGDVMGKSGRQGIAKLLPELKKQYNVDLVVANAENLAHGRGVTPSSVKELLDCGVDVLTGGNHSLDNEQGIVLFSDPAMPLIRPLNLGNGLPGKGFIKMEKSGIPVIIFNLIGRVFMKKDYANPFPLAEQFVQEHKNDAKIFILDWHADATSEKVAMGWLLSGRATAVLGTHAHVPTADWKILPGGTGFVSDIGMCGADDSIIGMEKTAILKQFLEVEGPKPDIAEGPAQVNAILLTIDENSGKTSKILKIQQIVDNF